jgi:hypothetical protein
MIRLLHAVLAASLVVGAFAAPAGAQTQCDGRSEQRVDQENYLALSDRVYIYVPDISSTGSSGGWQSFNVRVLSGTYRKPLLLTKAFMKENDLQSLLSTRRDIRQSILSVPAYDPRRGAKPALTASAAVRNGERPGTITVRVTRVVPVSGGVDHLFIVCSTGN